MNAALIKCYIGKTGDEENTLSLYPHLLSIIFKGKLTNIPLDQIHSLLVTRKKLIIPLVLGGIGTSMSWLALSLGWYHYYTNILVIFLFFGWMYYGFVGRDALEIKVNKHTHLFLISTNHQVINSFLQFIRLRLTSQFKDQGQIIFHLAHKEDWEKQIQSHTYSHDSLSTEGFIHGSFSAELKTSYEKYFTPQDQLILLIIDLASIEADVKMEQVPSRGATFPHIYGKLNKTAIRTLINIHKPGDLDQILGIAV